MKIVKYSVTLLALTTLIACNSDTDAPAKTGGQIEIATPETPVQEAFVPQNVSFEDAVKGTDFEGWDNNLKATGITTENGVDGVVFKISNIGYLRNFMHEPKPAVGETYKFSVDMKDTDFANGNGEARLMISRDCSTADQEYSLEEFALTATKATYSVSHTFKANYDCFSYGILIHGASEEAPRTIQISNPIVQKVN